jgi:protein-S-isoprenylcysteine O-methyltransferase Ste14
MDTAASHFGQWTYVVIWTILGAIFLAFTPFNKRSERKPAGVYLSFIVAMAFEMFGIPMSMYILTWILGTRIPEGILWGHTLFPWIGHTGMYVGTALMIAGAALVIVGWNRIYRQYWRKSEGKGELVTSGIYRLIRHPQYTGFMLITLGMLLDWATLPMLMMWPILVGLYMRLASKEEVQMEAEFGPAYAAYKARTGRFLPAPWKRLRAAQRSAQWPASTSL